MFNRTQKRVGHRRERKVGSERKRIRRRREMGKRINLLGRQVTVSD